MKNSFFTSEDIEKIEILSIDYNISKNKIKQLLTLGYTLDILDERLEFETYEELRDGLV